MISPVMLRGVHPRLLLSLVGTASVCTSHCGLFPTPRPTVRPECAAAWPASGPGAGPDNSERLLGAAPARQGPGSVVPRLVWHRQELCGTAAGGEPVPRRAEE